MTAIWPIVTEPKLREEDWQVKAETACPATSRAATPTLPMAKTWLVTVEYRRPLPNAGRWCFVRRPLAGRVMRVRTPLTGIAL